MINMIKNVWTNWIWLALFLLFVSVLGFANIDTAKAQSNVASVRIAPETTQTIIAGQTVEFTAQAFDENNNPIAGLIYSWVNATNGVFNNTAAGTYDVYASTNGVQSNHVSVVVNSNSALTGIRIAPESAQTITAGQTVQFTVQGFDQYGNPIPGLVYNWNNTTGGLFNNSTVGTYDVYAYIGGLQSNHVSMTVNPNTNITTIRISPDAAQIITAGQTIQFTSQAFDQYSNPIPGLTYAWQGANSNGLFNNSTAGTYNVYAYINGMESNQVNVLVNPANLDHWDLSQNISNQNVGIPFNILLTPRDVYNNLMANYDWNSPQNRPNLSGLAGLATYNFQSSADGVATYSVNAANAENNVAIRATLGTAVGTTNQFNVFQSQPQEVSYFCIDVPAQTTAGVSFDIIITAYDVDGNIVTNFSGDVRLSGLNTSPNGNVPDYGGTISFINGVARVSITGYDSGQQRIVLTYGSIENTSDYIYFEFADLSSVVISTNDPTNIISGQTVQFTARGFDQYGNLRNVDTFTWENTSAVDSGLFNNPVVGTYHVFAYSNGIQSNQVGVTVNENTNVAFIRISPDSDQTITAGQSIQFTVQAFDRFGNPIPGLTYTWNNATGGLFNQTTAGTYIVYASNNGLNSNAVNVRVNPASLAEIDIFPDYPFELDLGDEIIAMIYAHDIYGNPVSDGTQVNWTRSNSQFSLSWSTSTTIYGFAWVFLTAPNQYNFSTTVSAQIGSTTATSASIKTISQPVPARIEISPNSDTNITAGQTIQFTAKVYDKYGNLIADKQYSWNNANSSGLFNITGVGEYEIYAFVGNVQSNKVKVTVLVGKPDNIVFYPLVEEIKEGEEFYPGVIVYDYYGNIIYSPEIIWSVDNLTGEGAIDSSAKFRSLKPGIVLIRAKAGDVTRYYLIRVVAKDAKSTEEISKKGSQSASEYQISSTFAPSEAQPETKVNEIKGTEIVTEGLSQDEDQIFAVSWWKYLWWIVPLIILLVILLLGYFWNRDDYIAKEKEVAKKEEKTETPIKPIAKKDSDESDKTNIRRW